MARWILLRPEWDDLAGSCERATVYQTWEWNEAWWRFFGPQKAPSSAPGARPGYRLSAWRRFT